MNFLNIIKHLLPRARAWNITIKKTLRDFFEGVAGGLQDVKPFADGVFLDLYPDTTRAVLDWENEFGIINNGLTDEQRRQRISQHWKLRKINTREQIENALQNSGFNVYVHEWWVPGTEPPVGVFGAPLMRDPTAHIIGNAYVLINGTTVYTPDIITLCGEPHMLCGDDDTECGTYYVYKKIYEDSTIPVSPEYWPYFIYIGGETFGNFADVDGGRRDEFEALCLKICPMQHWIGLFINYT